MKKRTKFLVMVLVMFIFFLCILPWLGSLAKAGVFKGIWSDVVDAFPMGSLFAEFVLHFGTKFISSTTNAADYLIGIQPIESFTELIQEFLKLCLSALLFGAWTKVGDLLIGIKDKPSGWQMVKKVVWHMFSALFCAVVASMVLTFAFGQINQLSPTAAGIWSTVIMLITLIGTGGAFYFLLGQGIVMAILYVLLKTIGMNILSMGMSYCLLLFLLLAFSEGVFVAMYGGFLVWIVILMLIIAIDTMLTSVFGK